MSFIGYNGLWMSDQVATGAAGAALQANWIIIADWHTTTLVDGDIGSTVQAYSSNLDTFSTVVASSDGISLIEAANYAAMKTLLGGIDTIVAAVDTSVSLQALANYKCNGTNDQIKINEALSSLPANGGTVLMLAGSYSISAAIAVPTNGWLKGDGVGTRITLANASNCDCITNDDWANGNQNIRVSDLYLNGNRANQTSVPAIGDGPGQSLITFCNVQGGSIKNIVGTGGFLHGIDLTVRDIVDNDPNADVTKDIVVDTVEFSDCGDDGITTHWVTGVTITNAVCHDAAATYSASSNGIEIDDGSSDILVSNSICYSNVSGFRVQGHTGRMPACNVSFVNCEGYDNSSTDYTATYQTPRGVFNPKGVSFTNCVAKSTSGVSISDYSEVTIKGCIFINSLGLDFRSYDDTGTYKARDIVFTGNTILGNETLPGYGIALLTSSGALTGNGVVIANNTIIGTRYSAIKIENTRNEVIISGNIIRDCGKNLGGSTVFTLDLNSAEITITNNMLLQNARGISIGPLCRNVKAIGNHVEHTGATTGIRIDGDEVDVVNNTIQCAQYAVHLPTSTVYTRLRISGNNLTGSNAGNALRNDAALDYTTAGIIVQENHGYVTENSGTATIASGATSVNVTHGLAFAPSLQMISVTPTNDLGDATKFWISAVAATTFTITVDADPGDTTATFSWSVQVH